MTRNARITRPEDPGKRTRLPIIGRVRIGEKRLTADGKEYPVSLDYFKATGDYAVKFTEAYGEKPSRIQVVFISDDPWESCYEEWEGRDKQGRKAGYGDGETYYLFNDKTGEYHATASRDEVVAYSKTHDVAWKIKLTVNFLLPKIRGVFGLWQFQTAGERSTIKAVRGVWDEMQDMIGTVVNVPFDLVIKKVKSDKPRAARTFPVVNLVPNISTENMELLRSFITHGLDVKRAGMLTEEKILELRPAVGDTPADEQPPAKAVEPKNNKLF